MNNITIDDLLKLVSNYKQNYIDMIKKAYDYADYLHEGQKRQSGEPYIIHPLNVAYILCEMSGKHADADTICAALLHDTLEDTKATKKEIEEMFNSDVANLVDGVTKISRMNFSSETEQNLANTRKIITGITDDVRIIIIKLADRLHNMRTLQYKTVFKQKENALETMEIFIPLAYFIGAYRIKNELEDLSFKYLYPEEYKRLTHQMTEFYKDSESCIKEMYEKIDYLLGNENIPHEIKIRTKNIYGIYKKRQEGYKNMDIHDLLALKIMVDEITNCYLTVGLIHKEYKPLQGKFRDYIGSPKLNQYQSLHTTVFGKDGRLVQNQIRTFEMDQVASFGLPALWGLNMGHPRDVMQAELRSKSPLYRTLADFNIMFKDNNEFVSQVKSELFTNNIYVYSKDGEMIGLPKGSNIVDYACYVDIEKEIIGARVNDEEVFLNCVLKNKDRIVPITDKYSSMDRNVFVDIANTSFAKKKLMERQEKTWEKRI